MARIRKNFFEGTLSSQLLVGATTLQSSALSSFPAVTGTDVAYLVIDPAGSTPEIVKVTAHTASATSATIVRGQDSTTDRTWAAGTTVIQAAIASDVDATELAADAAFTGSYLPKAASATPRTPITTLVPFSPATSGTDDFVSHLLQTVISGNGWGAVVSTNSGYVWGSNIFTTTGTAASDGDGISNLIGALAEASVRSHATITNVTGFQAEAAFMSSSAAPTVDTIVSARVSTPKRKDGATGGTATNVYSLYVESTPTDALGSSNAWAVYVEGGQSSFGGLVQVTPASASDVALDIVGKPSQTAHLVEIHDGVGNLLGRVTSSGAINTAANVTTREGQASQVYVGYIGIVPGDASGLPGLQLGGSSGPKWLSGAGSPEAAVTAPVGSLYTRTDGGTGSTLYVKESGTGNTGWVTAASRDWNPPPIVKGSDETVNNSTTLQNDNDLAFALGANETWLVRGQLLVACSSGQSADFKIAATLPTGSTFALPVCGPQLTETNGPGGAIGRIQGTMKSSGVHVACGLMNDTADGTPIKFEGIVKSGGTAGTFQVQWAQTTATVVDTTVLASGSYLERRRIA